MWFWSKSVAAEDFASQILGRLINSEDCWNDLRALRDYAVPDTVALSEMAFARAGLTQAVFEEELDQPVSERAIEASNAFLYQAFKDQNNPDAHAFYEQSLVDVVPDRVNFYRENAFPLARLAASIGSILKVRGHPASEALFMFEAVNAKVRLEIDRSKPS